MELSGELRETTTLFIYEEMSRADIVGTLGCRPRAAETRIYRARPILREKLKDIRH